MFKNKWKNNQFHKTKQNKTKTREYLSKTSQTFKKPQLCYKVNCVFKCNIPLVHKWPELCQITFLSIILHTLLAPVRINFQSSLKKLYFFQSCKAIQALSIKLTQLHSKISILFICKIKQDRGAFTHKPKFYTSEGHLYRGNCITQIGIKGLFPGKCHGMMQKKWTPVTPHNSVFWTTLSGCVYHETSSFTNFSQVFSLSLPKL